MTSSNPSAVRTHSVSSHMFEGEERQKLSLADETICLDVRNLNLYYGADQALKGISLKIPAQRVTAFIGPSGCGKSTLLRCFNRMNDLIDSCRIEGEVLLDGEDIFKRGVDVAELRRKVGMVFQKPNPFPKSIYENVAYGLRLQGVNNRRILDEAVEKALTGAALWGEVEGPPQRQRHGSCPAASSSVWSSPAPSPSSRRCCCWTSRPRPWTRSPR